MQNEIQIKGVVLFGTAAVLFFCLPYFRFEGDETQIMNNGVTMWDFIYFTSGKIGQMFGVFTASCGWVAISNLYPNNLFWYFGKYVFYSLSGIFFMRMAFHWSCYEEISNFELSIFALIVVVVGLRGLMNKGHLKTLSRLCHRIAMKFHITSM